MFARGKYLVDSNDWGSLDLQQVGARRNADGISRGSRSSALPEI